MVSLRQVSNSSLTSTSSPWTARTVSYILLVAILIVFIKNFWLNEDAFIYFRGVEQLHAGNGAVWNVGERVQIYTSVAWYWLLAGVNAVVHNIFETTIITTTGLFIALLMLARRVYGDSPALWFLLTLFLLSKSFFDYTSAGLENSLAYITLLALYAACRSLTSVKRNSASRRQLYVIAVLTGFIPLVRHDLTLLCAPVFALLLWQQRRDLRGVLIMLVLAGVPLLSWTVASLVYYGLPLPNPAYAKLHHGYDTDVILQTGLVYFYGNIRFDPLTVLVIAVAPIIAFFKLQSWQRAFALGVLLYCFYLLTVGGDYMAGRFLSYPFLVAALLLADWLRHVSLSRTVVLPALAVIAAYLWLIPATPLITPWSYGRNVDLMAALMELKYGILNMRLVHYPTTLAAWWYGDQRAPHLLETFRRDGENLRQSGDKVVDRGAVGVTGYYAGLNVHIVDTDALADPFLAQLPAQKRIASGHFRREVVPGYIDHLLDGVSPIHDARLNQYYQVIELLTRSPDLFSTRRLKAIVAFNLGRYDYLLDVYRRDIALRRK